MSSTNNYTCNSCGLAFPTHEDQRFHMKTDWHRYNLKRRVASLPAISEDLFAKKVSNLSINDDVEDSNVEQKKSNKQVTKKEQRRREREALLEKKRQLLELAKQKMLSSGGVIKVADDGKVTLERSGSESQQEQSTESVEPKSESKEVEGVEGPEETTPEEELTEEQLQEKLMEEKYKNKVDIPLETCLFCNLSHDSLDDNLEHMFKKHGLYIPEIKFLVDREGLIQYLSEKIGFGNVCLVCNYQGRNLESVRQHMLAKSHCKIPYDSENEKLEISNFYDFTSSYNDVVEGTEEDWEDVEDGEQVDSDEETDIPQDNLYSTGYELHLPNGAVIGHRSLARYYRQNLRPDRELSEGQGTVIAAETRHFVKQIDRHEIAEQKRVWAREGKSKDRDDRRAQKFINWQPHYRDQLLQ